MELNFSFFAKKKPADDEYACGFCGRMTRNKSSMCPECEQSWDRRNRDPDTWRPYQ